MVQTFFRNEMIAMKGLQWKSWGWNDWYKHQKKWKQKNLQRMQLWRKCTWCLWREIEREQSRYGNKKEKLKNRLISATLNNVATLFVDACICKKISFPMNQFQSSEFRRQVRKKNSIDFSIEAFTYINLSSNWTVLIYKDFIFSLVN